MSSLRFPCRVCGTFMEGVDTYVVCAPCLQDFDDGLRTGIRFQHVRPYDGLAHTSLTPEDESRLRHLLDW